MSVFSYLIETTKKYRLIILSMFFCVLLIAIDGNFRPYIIKMIIDEAADFKIERFTYLTALFFISQIVMITANASFDWLGTKFHTHYRAETALRYFDKLSNYNYKFFQETHSGSITARITDTFNLVPLLVFTFTKIFINFVFFISISLLLLGSVNIYFAIGSLIWIFVFILLSKFFYNKYDPLNDEFAKVRPRIYGFLSDYFSNILSVWFFANKSSDKKLLKIYTDDFIKKGTKCGIFLRNYYAVHGIIVAIYMLVLLIALGYLAENQKITAGDFALVFMINYKIVDLLFEISSMSREFVTNLGVVKNAITMLDSIEDTDSKTEFSTKNDKDYSISFSNVEFSYHNSEKIFNKFNIKIKNNEKIGLVGYSGSGKSTFINLLLRLYECEAGNICIGNNNIKKMNREGLRKLISVIPQDPNLFHRTIMENIRYGKSKASEGDVINAAIKAKAHDFIIGLENGYDTVVGEKGTKLSGGQRQRIVIARAILKNSPIFILDEATSQLDSVTENHIKDNLSDILTNKTAIIVAHRFSTLNQVDRIFVFNKGKIVEQGSRDELLLLDGVFKKMWNSQQFK